MAEGDMTFWEHLDELRKVIFRPIIVLIVLMCLLFTAKTFIFNNIVFGPIDNNFILYRGINYILALLHQQPLPDYKLHIINIDLPAQFFIHVSTTFYVSLLIAMPYLFYELWTFVRPALYPKEKHVVEKAFGFAGLLFYTGVLVGYFLVFPLTLRFLGTYQVSTDVINTISLRSYINMFISMILIMGIVFEFPILAAILSKIGIINKQMLKKYRRHAFVILLIVSAGITPSGDPFTLFAVDLPLYALYEISIAMCKSKKEDEEDTDSDDEKNMKIVENRRVK